MAARLHAEVLYIHPSGHLNDLVVPTGAISCLNALKAPRLGRYAFEVQDDEIRAARIVAVDLHWSVGLPGFGRLVRHVRDVHPEAVLVAGGITAGHYAQTLLELYPIDFVVRGDSEVAFAALVDAVLSGRTPEGIPNVYGRGLPLPRLARMSRQEFDATDPLTVEWFPTYAQVTDWQSAAFSQGRTIPVARGCPFRCPTCYGSYAEVFGKGYLVRSPASVVERVRQAQALGVRHLRLIVGKPGPRALSEMVRALAASGPHRFEGSVGLYLCTPPSDEDLQALDEAFDGQLDLSAVPPEEHVPRLSRETLAEEGAAWDRVARFAASSRHIHLDLWATDPVVFRRLRGAYGVERTRRVTVSLGAVWHVTRPVTGEARATLDRVSQAMDPVWTFFAARLLSPSLARLLRPFQFLDALTEDLDTLEDPGGVLSPFFRLLMANWREHHVPTLPGLAFGLAQVALRLGARLTRERHGTRFRGAMGVASPEDLLAVGAVKPMATITDHRGVVIEGRQDWPAVGGAIAVLPLPLDGPPVGTPWVLAIAGDGLVVIRPPQGTEGRVEEMTVRLTLRVQDVQGALLADSGEVVALGRADLGYFEAPLSPHSRWRGSDGPGPGPTRGSRPGREGRVAKDARRGSHGRGL